MANTSNTQSGAPLPMAVVVLEQEATRLIQAAGWKITKGPYFNVNLARQGLYVWSIKSVLSFADLKKRGIKVPKSGKQGGSERTVRFMGEVVDGQLMSVKHISTAHRKKLGRRKRPRNRKAKAQ